MPTVLGVGVGVSAPWELSCRELSGGALARPPADVRSSMTKLHDEGVQGKVLLGVVEIADAATA